MFPNNQVKVFNNNFSFSFVYISGAQNYSDLCVSVSISGARSNLILKVGQTAKIKFNVLIIK